jgi:hypothetical protein
MTLRAIHGKPGSGKSCYCVSLLVKQLSDWVRYDREHDESFGRVLYTNIPLHLDAINEHLAKELCVKEVDVSEHVEVLDDSFFRDDKGDYREWWLDFPEGAFIVIDEVHHYLPASIKRKKGGQDYADKFTNYVSMHRHRQHDIILLSQHLDNVSPEVKKQIDTVYEVLNVKNRILGVTPFTVPMADVDVVREAWGFPVQMAHIRRGICEARRILYDKGFDVFVMTPTLFALYRSHTKSDEALDRPSLKLGKIGSLFWFARRHGFRLLFWAIVAVSVLMAFKNMFTKLPSALVEGMMAGVNVPADYSPAASRTSTPVFSSPGGFPSPAAGLGAADAVVPSAVDSVVAGPIDDKVSGFVKNGIITARGVLRVGDTMRHEGVDEKITKVVFSDSTVFFESGNKYKK